MAAYLSKILGAGGLLLAVATLAFLPALSGYDAATGATSTTTTTTTTTPSIAARHYVARIGGLGTFTRTVTARKEQFTGSVKIPLPNTALGLADATTAAAADLVLVLSRHGVAYAECALDFVGVNKQSRTAKYKVDLISRRGAVRQTAGLCQLLVAPLGPGIPQPATHDRLELKVIHADGQQTFASGVFVKRG